MTQGLTQAEAASRARLLRIESYQVFLELTTGGDTAQSRTEIRFACREPGSATFADLDALAVQEVTLNGVPVDPAASTEGRLPLPDLASSNTLIVDATVTLSDSGAGLTRYTDLADGRQYILANCFPTAAPSVFCCFDQADLQAEFTLIVTLPAEWTCVANGEGIHHPDDGAAGVWRFSPVAAMKPYEFTLCAGPYVSVPGATDATALPTRLAVRCRASLAQSPGLARIAAIVGAALSYYDQVLDVPCPYDKLDIVFAPELGPLAMQLPAVMYVSETLLQRAADPDDDHVAIVLAHEAAHLWFGCLVEAGWWDDLWLAEALASYLSFAAAAAVLGQPDAWAEFAMDGEAGAYQADGLPNTQPISSPVDSAAHALTRPAPITYSKGTAVLRQLAAFIGDDAMWAGLHDYLTRFARRATSLTDIIECWSRASGRDLSAWAEHWLRQSGVNALRPEITVGPDGVITSLAIAQAEPPTSGPLRPHQLTVGLYEQDGTQLRRRRQINVRLTRAWTHIPELTGTDMPAAIVLNDTDLTFATIGIDPASWRSLVACAMDVADPLAEAVCWTAAWEMVQAAEVDAAEFAAIVARRMFSGRPVVGFEQLLERALAGADYYSAPDAREATRQQLAAAALAGVECGQPGSRAQLVLARGFAASANSPAQLDLLRFWLDGRSLPAGLVVDRDLRARILPTLAANDLASDADLTAYAAQDPVAGDTLLATWQAMRPSAAAKDTAFAAALAADQPARLALASAQGFWVPGQQKVVAGFEDRYFTEALPVIGRHPARTAQRLARALYPATQIDARTLASTNGAIAGLSPADPARAILLEQRALLQRRLAAQAGSGRANPSG